jgi:glutaredoxin
VAEWLRSGLQSRLHRFDSGRRLALTSASQEGAMAVKLHRCPVDFIKGPHPCWRVQKALDDAGVDYEIVREPNRRSKRDRVEEMTGQRKLPFIEFEDGRTLREESTALAERVRSGRLFEESKGAAAPPAADAG